MCCTEPPAETLHRQTPIQEEVLAPKAGGVRRGQRGEGLGWE